MSNLAWLVQNMKMEGNGWRGFFSSDITMMSDSDFYFIFPEANKQEERDKKINKILGI